MRRAALLALVSLPAFSWAADDPASRLIARLQAGTPIVSDLQQLTDVLGGRPTGSRAYDRSVEWALGRFREAGLETVRAEEFAAPHLWLPRVEVAEVLAPVAGPLRVAAMPLSASTPAAGLVLWMSTRPQRLLYRHNATLDGSTFPLPGAVVEREGALRLARAAAWRPAKSSSWAPTWTRGTSAAARSTTAATPPWSWTWPGR